jgi:2-iminobutanoate/2-iminopropanoate deaminase
MAKRPAIHDVINSRKAPKPIGPYVQALRVKNPGEMLFVSGQIPIEANGRAFTGDIKRQAEIALGNLRNIITDAKFTMDEVVKVTIFLTDMANFEKVNLVYQKNFVGESLPTRAVVAVAGLPKDVGIEVTAVAVKKGASAEDMFADSDF